MIDPVAIGNRTYEALKLQLTDNCYYFALPGELYAAIDEGKAKQNFQKALVLVRTKSDKQTITKRINKL